MNSPNNPSAPYTIDELKGIITPIARKYGVERVLVFGSYGRNQATAQSDVDLHIEKGRIRTLLDLIAFQQDIDANLSTSVDIITSGIRDKRFLDRIAHDEVVIY